MSKRKYDTNKNNFAPDDETINSRVEIWSTLLSKYENCKDNNDEGYDMDTLIAIAEAEDSNQFVSDYEEEYNPENINPKEEAIEEITNEPENCKKFANTKDKLTFYFSPHFIEKAAEDYQKRCKELEQRNLPFWNFRKDERYHETHSKFPNGFSSSRNYESNTVASIGNIPSTSNANPRQDQTFLSSNLQLPAFNPESFKLPPEIHQYIQNNSIVNVKIREYDLTVCKDPLNSSISLSIPTINTVQALPASIDKTPKIQEESQHVESYSNSVKESLNEDSFSTRFNNTKIESDQPTIKNISLDKSKNNNSKKSLETLLEKDINDYDTDDIKISDISTAGSSLSTEDDDHFFIGGTNRFKLRRLNHRLKKMEKRREERKKKLKLAAKEKEAVEKLKISDKLTEVMQNVSSESESTPDEEDFFAMVSEAIKKHNDTVLKEKTFNETNRTLRY